jgi:hypothetical protein
MLMADYSHDLIEHSYSSSVTVTILRNDAGFEFQTIGWLEMAKKHPFLPLEMIYSGINSTN